MSYQIEDFQNFNQFSFIQNGLELRKKLEEELKSYNRKQTVVLFRHGHRTPFKYRQPGISALLEDSFYGHLDMQCFEGKEELLYRNIQCISSASGSVADLNLQFDVHKQNAGMLTRLGASQLNTVGRKLKERYSEDLKKIITICSKNKSEPLLNISTKTERTIESLQSVLLGLFQDEKTQPSFRVKVLDTSENNWLGYSLHRHPDLLDGIGTAHSHDFKCKYIKGYEPWASSLIQTTGASPQSIDLQMIRDYMTSFERFGYPLPDSLSQIAEDKVLCGRMTTYAVAAESMLVEKGIQKTAGPFFEALLQILGNDDKILALLSAHDTTVNFVRLALRANDFTWPDFGHNIEFELYEHKETKQKMIMVLYNLIPIVLKVLCKSDTALIPFEEFVEYVKRNLTL